MRVARRRSDGGWDFTDPLSPFSASPMTPPRFPYARAESIYSLQSSAAHSTTSFIKKDKLPGELTTRGYVEYDAEGLPPPAYDATSESHHSSANTQFTGYGYGHGHGRSRLGSVSTTELDMPPLAHH